MKIAACVEYDGSKFCGWQIQIRQPSVQAAVESALSQIACHPIRVHCAGRTDTGVHACGQIIHFETRSERSEKAWVMGTNSYLPEGVSVIWARQVDASFHARFSAHSRQYRYVLLNRNVRPTYLARRVGWYPRRLDVTRMQTAARALLGTHDFSAYRSARCKNKVPVKTVSQLEIASRGGWIWVDVQASGFLHHMVRNIVGTLIAVGCGDKPVEWPMQVLKQRDRKLAGMTASADGLYFVTASYPDAYELPSKVVPCKFW